MKHLILFFYLACIGAPFFGRTQNLIRNSSFETHADLPCLTCKLGFGKYPAIMSHWDNSGWGCTICDESIPRNSDDIKSDICPMERVKPHDGNTMIEMRYMPTCGGDIHEGADYLTAHTTQAMEVGKMYEIRFWIHIESKKRSDPEWASHIGMMILPQNLKMHGLYQTKLILPFLPIDTVRYDEWYQVKWRVRPLCTSHYLMIGVFESPTWHQNRSYVDVKYWLDQVTVQEVPGARASADSSVYYCSKYDPVALGVPPMLDQQTLLFENDAYALSSEHKTSLDSFAVQVKKHPGLVFEISGHTDSIGTTNQLLSENRAKSVLEYFVQTHQISPARFIVLAKAGKDPVQPNFTEAGRVQNRRVLIRQSELSMENAFYRAALQAMADKRYPEAFVWLNKWLSVKNIQESSPPILYFDPRFAVLHKDPRWKTLESKIRQSYRSLKYATFACQLDSMRMAGQSATAELTTYGYRKGLNALPGYVPDLDTLFFELDPQPDAIIKSIQSAHYTTLVQMMTRTGWPKQSEWGITASASAFAIFMQSSSLVDRLKWLPELKKRCEEGEAPWIYYARLYDQCNVGLAKPQRYGTVISVYENGIWEVKPWEGTVETVNEERAKIGLPMLDNKAVEAMLRKGN